jgi:hypothetical protein
MTAMSKYLYGIIEEPQSKTFELSGLAGAAVYTINSGDLAAVVSDIELSEIDPTRKNVMAHTMVQDGILKKYTFIPMGFGIVAASEASVRSLLDKNYPGLVSELKRLADKIEVELKIFWDDKALASENQQLINKVQTRVKAASSTAEAQRLLTEAGMQVEKIVLAWKAKYVDQIYASLKTLAIDSRLNNCSGIKMLLNASFLIDRKTESEFVEQVRILDAKYQGNINFKYIGPLSPYNFVGIKLEMVN